MENFGKRTIVRKTKILHGQAGGWSVIPVCQAECHHSVSIAKSSSTSLPVTKLTNCKAVRNARFIIACACKRLDVQS